MRERERERNREREREKEREREGEQMKMFGNSRKEEDSYIHRKQGEKTNFINCVHYQLF